MAGPWRKLLVALGFLFSCGKLVAVPVNYVASKPPTAHGSKQDSRALVVKLWRDYPEEIGAALSGAALLAWYATWYNSPKTEDGKSKSEAFLAKLLDPGQLETEGWAGVKNFFTAAPNYLQAIARGALLGIFVTNCWGCIYKRLRRKWPEAADRVNEAFEIARGAVGFYSFAKIIIEQLRPKKSD
jgi:hypothetical protein